MCGCGRRMRMAPSVLARGPVVCGLCVVRKRHHEPVIATLHHGCRAVDRNDLDQPAGQKCGPSLHERLGHYDVG